MDALSDVLALLKPRSYRFRGFEAGGEWAIRFPVQDGIKYYAVIAGTCWLAVDGVADPIQLKSGDCFLLPLPRSFRIASDLGLDPSDAVAIFSQPTNGGAALLNGGGSVSGLGGFFTLAGNHAELLLGVLPPIVHIRRDSDKQALRWAMERMREELREPRPGSFLILQNLANLMLIEALRAHLAASSTAGVGWLFALADKQIGAAINAIHGNPAQRWNLRSLADRAGMSRSIFATRFKATVGVSPITYLTRWRMLLAGQRLLDGGDAISTIALSLGYDSDSAFSTAFKRFMKASPRHYRRLRATAAPPEELAA